MTPRSVSTDVILVHGRRVAASVCAGVGAVALAMACSSPATQSGQPHGPRHPPPKPGESITRTMMCSCTACEPVGCCRELEQDQPPVQSCADGYDFSKCGLSVQSCDSRCFQHRWRVRIEVGCETKRPAECCHATPDF